MNNKIHGIRLIIKTAALIALIALLAIPLVGDSIGSVSLYNSLLPGRTRFPYSDYPDESYNISLYNLNAMFASHSIADKNRPPGTFRVFVLGDSSIWGTLLKPEETLVGQLNALGLHTLDGRPVIFFNLGYPTLALTKDLMLLDRALNYEPDMIIWMLTLESFPEDKQLISPLVENNPAAITKLFEEYQLKLPPGKDSLKDPSYWDKSLFGQRRNLADIFRLQLYGVMWAITGIDQYYPDNYEPAARDLSDDPTYHDWHEGEMTLDDLALDVLLAGKQAADGIPMLFVNEPILVSAGLNSDTRYNFYYPRWAYDEYRQILSDLALTENFQYLDLWDIVPENEFTNTAIHTTPAGVRLAAEKISAAVLGLLSDQD